MRPPHEHPNIATKIAASFARQRLLQGFGAVLEKIEPGHVSLSVDIRPEFCQQHGFAHAGLTFALGDSAAGYSALTLMGEQQEVVTSEMKIHLLAPALGETMRADGHIIRQGRRQFVVGAKVWALKDGDPPRQIAEMLGTMVPVDPS